MQLLTLIPFAPPFPPLPPPASPQAFRAAQVLRDAITRLEGELAAARAALGERDRAIAQLQARGGVCVCVGGGNQSYNARWW